MKELENNALPPLPEVPDFLQGDQWFNTEIAADMLDFDEPYSPPRYTMERNGVPFADIGEIHIISGKPGNGKTGLMSQLEAVTLSGRFGNTIGRMVPHKVMDESTGKVREQIIPNRLLHIDTEQGKDDTVAFKNRVISMAGMSNEEAKKHFFILRLRDTEDAIERWRKILRAVWEIKPTDIFLDGMLDIVKDYNDQIECQPIVRKCMKLATYYDASLWAVLHENPMVDKLVGVLGSITQRKVSEIFTVQKIKQCDQKPNEQRSDLPDIYFRVKQVKARGHDVEDWLFEYVTSAGGWGQPIEINDNGTRAVETKETQFIREARERFGKLNWTSAGLSRTDIDSRLISQGVTSNRRRTDLINIAIENGILYKTGTAQRPKYHYKEMNINAPNDQAEDLPFDRPDDSEPAF
jgi:cyclophilin family peptidyl-prolyl cis-trans isomerase